MIQRIAKANRQEKPITGYDPDSKTMQRSGRQFRIFSSTSPSSRISRLRVARSLHYRTYAIPSKAALLNGEQDEFQGGALDTGAQRSVVGMKQAKAYCDQVGIDFNPVRSQTLFRFGKGRSRSLGKIPFVISTPQNILTIWVDVVPQNIPMLIGLAVLDRYSFQILSVYNELECVREKWRVSVERKHGLIYWDWPDTAETFFTRPQLERLHRHLLHPSTRKLYNLLRRAKPEELSSDTMKTLDEIRRTCETCQLYAPKQLVFRIRDSDAIRFNQELLLDVMYLEASKTKKGNQKPVLHIVDVGTKFQNAAFLPALDTTTIWNTFIKIWASLYVGFPESMLTDQGSVFMSKEWEYNCESASIELRHTGTESHNSLGAGETYHALLRRVYQKTRHGHPSLAPDLCLSITVKAVNSTVGPDGLCPQLLVFGIMPRFPTISKEEFPAQKERLRAMRTAREEYDRLVSRSIVDRGLRTLPPPAADHKFLPGDFVYLYREGVKHYTGPHLVASVEGKQIRIHVGDRTGPREFNISQVRPAPLTRIKSMDEILTSDKAGTHRVLYTEVLRHGDPRTPLFDDAKRQELMGLLEKGTFRVVFRRDIGPNPNIVPSRYVLAIKHSENGDTKLKARFVLGGHRDKEKHSFVHNSVNVKQSSVRILVALATILGFDLWSMDVKQAYLQSASNLRRDVYVRPDEMNLSPNELLQIIKPLYGLSDSGDYWCETFSRFHIHDLRMEQSTGDFALFFKRFANTLVAMSASYVDDVLQASDARTKTQLRRKLKDKFDITCTDTSRFIYTGIMIDSSNTELRRLSQAHYICKLQMVLPGASFDEYRSLRAKLMWTSHTRPDIACAVAMASQTTRETFSEESVLFLNRIVSHLKRTSQLCLVYPKLDMNSLCVVVYTDSSHDNLEDQKSQLGFIICLMDSSKKCSIIHFASRKSRRVARSSMAAETLAFVDGFDNAYLIRHDLERMLGRDIPLLMLTDCKLLFDALTRARYTTERRLMVDIASAREAYLDRTISNVGLIRSEFNPADGLTKVPENQALLRLIKTHIIDHPVEQYIIHSDCSPT